MYQNYPNPFNPSTAISYDLPTGGEVTLQIYDIRGHLVKTLQHGVQSAGHYELAWDGRNELGIPAVSGLYFYKLTSGDFSDIKKMICAK